MILLDPLRWHDRAEYQFGVGAGRKRWAHLGPGPLAPLDELHDFAGLIGLRRAWFQDGRHPHYDLRPRQHRAALMQGAMLVSTRHLARRIAIPLCAGFERHGCERGSTFSVSYDLDIDHVHFCSTTCRVLWEQGLRDRIYHSAN